MESNIFVNFLMQMLGRAPMLLVYLLGMVLALAFWRRCPRPALLTLLGTWLLLVISPLQTFLFLYLVQSRDDFGWRHETLGRVLSASGFVGSLVSAVAFGLILAAVFIGRDPPRTSRPDQATQS